MLNGQKGLGLELTLNNFAKRFYGVPYQYGYHDCFVMCLRWVDKNNKTDLRTQYRYKNKSAGLSLMAKHNKKYIFEFFDDHFKRTDTPKTGDLVAWRENQYGACGIMSGNKYLTLNSAGGLRMSTDNFYMAWSLNG